jgi:RNA polymerase sigma-70 factor, ECF subfamily
MGADGQGTAAPERPDLAERLRRGEMAALAEAYDQHHEHVCAFANRLVGDVAEAEDLVQETFLALPHAMRSFRGDASLRTFLIGIATNHARHHVRAASRRRAAHARAAIQDEGTSTISTSTDESTHRRELARALVRALDELPFDQRVAIVLCEVEERTAAEAAQIAGAPEATIRTRIFHAKKKLREILQTRGVR